MKPFVRTAFSTRLISLGILTANLVMVWPAREVAAQNQVPDSGTAGIEALHREDVAATLAGDPVALANLFTEDGIMIEPGSPVFNGRRAILSEVRKEHAAHPQMRTLEYKPDIRSLQILPGGWAIEWDYFDAAFRESPDSPVQRFRGRAVRVLRRQKDGTWKFARVIWNTEK